MLMHMDLVSRLHKVRACISSVCVRVQQEDVRAHISVQFITICAVAKSKCAVVCSCALRSAEILVKMILCADYQVLCSCKSCLKCPLEDAHLYPDYEAL